MKTWIAVLFSIGLLVACFMISVWVRFPVTWIMVVITSLWAAFDSSKIGLRRYKSGISYGPVVLFVVCVLIWIAGFPWYLSVRHRIMSGSAVLKDDSGRSPAAV